MSLSKNVDVLQQIKKYQKNYPNIDRPLLRTLIRMEYENQTLKNTKKLDSRSEETFLKKLDRALNKIFPEPKRREPLTLETVTINYSELHPKNAEIVAKIDFFSAHPELLPLKDKDKAMFDYLTKLIRDYHVKIGKARGR